MKNLNLIKRLWTDSHEKQTPQRFKRYAGMLLMLLTLSVGQMWGWTFSSAKVYFDNTNSNWNTPTTAYTEIFFEKSDGSSGETMSVVTGTKLFYWGGSWGDGNVSYIRFASVSSVSDSWEHGWWGGKNSWDRLNGNSKCNGMTGGSISVDGNNRIALYVSGTGTYNNTSAVDLASQSNPANLAALNSTQTIYSVVKPVGGSYESANSKATISISSYELTSHGTTTNRTPSLSTSESSETVTACRTALTTLTVGEVASGYQFDGWYTAATGGTELSTETEYSYRPTSATSVYARFSEVASYTLTVQDDGHGSITTPAGGTTSYTLNTPVSIAASNNTGYRFYNWTVVDGSVTFGNQNSASTTATVTSGTSATIQANFRENLTSVTLSANPSGTGTFSIGGASTSSTTAGKTTTRSVTANAITGYKFSSWSKDNNNISLSSTSTNPTTVSGCGTNGTSSTLTGNFVRTYAFIEGRFRVRNAAQDTWYYTSLDNGNWGADQTNIPFTYDETNHRFYLHTYATPSELSAQLSSINPYFFIKTSTSSNSLTNVTQYWSASNQTISSANTNYNLTHTGDFYNDRLRFNSNYTQGYVILYFDESKVWYTLEHKVTYDGNGKTGGTVPTDANYYANGTSVTVAAAPVGWAKTGYDFGGWNTANNGSGNNYTAGSGSFNITANTTLYAKWTQTVTLDPNIANHGVTGNGSAVVIYNGVSNTVSGFSSTTAATGYQVEGYYSDPTSGVKVLNSNGTYASDNVSGYIESGKWTHAGATTLYAHMEPAKYTITLDDNGSYGGNGSAKATYLSNKLTNIYAPTRGGYGVLGYYEEAGLTHLIADAGGNLQPNTTYTDASGNWDVTNGATLYAKWGIEAPSVLKIDGQLSGKWDCCHEMEKDGRIYTYTVYDIPAATYQFCFKNNSCEDYLKTTSSVCSSTKNAGNITWADSGDQWHNFTITTPSVGNVTVIVEYRESDALVTVNHTPTSGSSSWYMIGDCYKTWDADKATYEFKRNWRGMAGIYYRIENITNDKSGYNVYFKLAYANYRYGPKGGGVTVSLNTKYQAQYDANDDAYCGNVGWVWCVVDPRNGDNVQFWVENKTYYTLSTSSDHGTVTIKDNTYDLAATQYESGETVKISVSAAEGYLIDDITIGGSSIATDVHATSYNGTTSMPASDATLTVTYVQSYTLNYFIGTVVGTDGTISSSPTTASGSLVIGGNTVTLTAPAEKTGYTWKGWYLNNDGSGEQQCATKAYAVTVNADKTLYACYTEDTHTVTLANGGNGHVEIGGLTVTEVSGVGIATASSTITAVPDEGYYFVNWTGDINDGVTLASGSATSASITIKATADSKSITANFAADEKIYFDNTYTQWSNVYVYLFSNDCWYKDQKDGKGPGVAPTVNFVACAQMTLVDGEENLYEYAYHNSSHNYSFSHVAFATADQHTYGALYSGIDAAYRGDWNSTMPIYVAPTSYTTTNTVKYHNEGYWMMKETTYNTSVGYALRHKTGDKTSEEIGTFKATADGSHIASLTVRYDNETNRTYFINNIASENYSLDHTFTSADNGKAYDLYHYNNIVEFTVTPSSAGNYTIFLEQGPEHMQISIEYPVQIGDRRLVYSYTSGGTKYRYSDVIRASKTSATTSMYIDKDQSGAALKLQRCTGFDGSGNPTWSDVSGTTGWISYFNSKTKGVYQFDVNFAGTNDVSSTLSDIALYTGEYYIKTDCAPGGWANYTQNHMAENPNTAATFDYYFVKWIGNTTTNVQCVIANEYNNAISDTLHSDDILIHGTGVQHETLPEAANVRFSFNSTTNELKRTYLRGSTLSSNFVTLVPNATGYVYSAETDGTDYGSSNPKFADNGNWTYQMDAWIYPTSQGGVKTSYPGWSPITEQTLVPTTNTLMGGTTKGSKRYHVRLVYDYKTDYLMCAWVAGDVDNQAIDLKNNLLYVRRGQNEADQISISTGNVSNIYKAYGAIQLKRSDMIALSGNGAAYTEADREYCDYYISFPFNVKLSDVFGTGTYGKDWIVQKYNGAKRAQIGWFQETKTFWETMKISETMNANEGYVLLIERDNYNQVTDENWTNIGESGSVYLYFPSASNIGNIISTTATITPLAHTCNIHRSFTIDDKTVWHDITDSHWNMIGVPLFTSEDGNFSSTFVQDDSDAKLGYLYEWNKADNVLEVADATDFTFKSMHGYMVQYYGDITFTGSAISTSVAARRLPSNNNYKIELRMTNGAEKVSRAYVELRENACDTFMLNEDVYMMSNNKKDNIYTFAGNYPAAANVMPISDQVVSVGMDIKQAGIHTFSMPSDFSGTVTLIDNYTGTRTNLNLGDYEVSLPAGTHSDRFALEINIHQIVTDLEHTAGEGSLKDGGVHKFLKDGVLYILRDGRIFDARGNRVE